ncbi:MAG: hypothetical protein ACOH2V_14095 [Candidatus Saccharimonadaceae bacterium]
MVRPTLDAFITGYIKNSYADTCKSGDEIEKRSCTHLVYMGGKPIEVIRTGKNRCDHSSQEGCNSRNDEHNPVAISIFRVESILFSISEWF